MRENENCVVTGTVLYTSILLHVLLHARNQLSSEIPLFRARDLTKHFPAMQQSLPEHCHSADRLTPDGV